MVVVIVSHIDCVRFSININNNNDHSSISRSFAFDGSFVYTIPGSLLFLDTFYAIFLSYLFSSEVLPTIQCYIYSTRCMFNWTLINLLVVRELYCNLMCYSIRRRSKGKKAGSIDFFSNSSIYYINIYLLYEIIMLLEVINLSCNTSR